MDGNKLVKHSKQSKQQQQAVEFNVRNKSIVYIYMYTRR